MAKAPFRFRLNTKQWTKAVRQFPDLLYRHMRPGLEGAARNIVNRMKLERLRGRPGLKARSGDLRRSLNFIQFGKSLETAGFHVYFDHGIAPYARHQEAPPAESIIKPVKSPWLTIPMKQALTPRGTLKGEYNPGSGSLRSIPGLFVVERSPEKGGGKFLCKRVGSETKFLFVLVGPGLPKTQVVVKRRLGFKKLFRSALGKAGSAMKFLREGLRKATREFNSRRKGGR